MSQRSVADILDELFPDEEEPTQEQVSAPASHRKPTAADIEAATEDGSPANGYGWEDEVRTSDWEPRKPGQTAKDEPRAKASGERTTNNDDPDARAEVAEMQKQAPLLDAIREDTGEQGRASGNAVYFKKCPICGHSDCFRFCSSRNLWTCYGGSNDHQNANGCEVGGFLEYMQRARNMTPTEAMTKLREATNHPYKDRAGKVDTNTNTANVGKPGANAGGNANAGASNTNPKNKTEMFDRLDGMVTSTADLTGKNRRPKPKYIIAELISEHSVNMIAAPSKQCKSWAALSMCWAVANGSLWMGHFKCNKGRVLYVDIELGQDWLSQRLDDVKKREGHTEDYDTLSLKGDIYTSLDDLRQWLTTRHPEDYDMVVIDPLYLFEQGEENAAETWIPIMLELSGMQAGCSCAIVYVHHFSKGWANQAPENRPAGSGVIGRYYEQGVLFSPRQLDAKGESDLHTSYGDKARVYELYTMSRNYEDSGIKSVVWDWPSFYADDDHAFDSYPIMGSVAGNKILNSDQSSERIERVRSAKDEAVSEAVAQCHEAGISPTRKNVYPRLRKPCERFGVPYPSSMETFRNWTSKGGPTHWRCDPERGYELHAIDVNQMDEDGNAPFLPMPDEI